MTRHIGVGGPKGVGKDTFSKGLANALNIYGVTCRIERLADPLYFLVENLTGLGQRFLQDQSRKEAPWTEADAPFPSLAGKSVRDLLINTGKDLRCRYGEDVLVQALKARIKGAEVKYTIVTDVRTDIEAQAMDIVFELRREGITYKGGKTESGFSLPVIPVTLTNDPSRPDLGCRYGDILNFIEEHYGDVK
jgi:hypothetical protein